MNSPLSVLGDTLNKNPICILNEFSLKTSSKISFEYTNEDNDFLAFVIYNNKVIGTGKDKKKQLAKTKAAENAVLYLTNSKSKENTDEILNDLVKKFGKKGNFKLSFQDPVFIYEYYLSGSRIAEGRGLSESSAKEKCIKSLNEKLTLIEDFETKPSNPSSKLPKSLNLSQSTTSINSLHPTNPLSNPDSTTSKNPSKSSDWPKLAHQEATPIKRIKVEDNILASNVETCIYFEKLLSSFELSKEELQDLCRLEDEIQEMSDSLGLQLVPIGSYSLGLLRRTKLVLDFCIVTDSASKAVGTIFESLEKARIIHLKFKEVQQKPEAFALSYSPKIENSEGADYILLENEGKFSVCIYFLNRTLCNDLKCLMNKVKGNKQARMILRHWRQAKGLKIKTEVLDLIADDCGSDDGHVGLVRSVIEAIAGGALLDGACRKFEEKLFYQMIKGQDLDEVRKIMKEAQEFLIAFHRREVNEYFG